MVRSFGMAKKYLRPAYNWVKLLGPRSSDTFFMNVTGQTIRLYWSPTELSDTSQIKDVMTFPVGGSIAQIKVPRQHHIYAKAYLASDSTESTDSAIPPVVYYDDTKIPWDTAEITRDEFHLALMQFLHSLDRVTDLENTNVRNEARHYIDQRQFLNSIRLVQENEAQLNAKLVNLGIKWLDIYNQNYKNSQTNARIMAKFEAFHQLEQKNRELVKGLFAIDLAHSETEATIFEQLARLEAIHLDDKLSIYDLKSRLFSAENQLSTLLERFLKEARNRKTGDATLQHQVIQLATQVLDQRFLIHDALENDQLIRADYMALLTRTKRAVRSLQTSNLRVEQNLLDMLIRVFDVKKREIDLRSRQSRVETFVTFLQ